MGDYTTRTSPAELADDAVLSGSRIHPKHTIQTELPEVSVSEELQRAAEADEDEGSAPGYEDGPRQKTGGRQKGTPNKVARVDIAKVCRVYSLRAVETLIDVMEDDKQPGATRIAAASALLDRAHGKPKQMTEISGPDGAEIQTKLTIEFLGQPPVSAKVQGQIEQDDGKVIDVQMQTIRVPEQRKPWDPE